MSPPPLRRSAAAAAAVYVQSISRQCTGPRFLNPRGGASLKTSKVSPVNTSRDDDIGLSLSTALA